MSLGLWMDVTRELSVFCAVADKASNNQQPTTDKRTLLIPVHDVVAFERDLHINGIVAPQLHML